MSRVLVITLSLLALCMGCQAHFTDMIWSVHSRCPSSDDPLFYKSCSQITGESLENMQSNPEYQISAFKCGCGLLGQGSNNIFYKALITSELETLNEAIEEALMTREVLQALGNKVARSNSSFHRINIVSRSSSPGQKHQLIQNVLEYFNANWYSPITGESSKGLKESTVMIGTACDKLTKDIQNTLDLLLRVSFVTGGDLAYYNLLSTNQDLLKLANLNNFCAIFKGQ